MTCADYVSSQYYEVLCLPAETHASILPWLQHHAHLSISSRCHLRAKVGVLRSTLSEILPYHEDSSTQLLVRDILHQVILHHQLGASISPQSGHSGPFEEILQVQQQDERRIFIQMGGM